LSVVFEAPTIAELAANVERGSPPEDCKRCRLARCRRRGGRGTVSMKSVDRLSTSCGPGVKAGWRPTARAIAPDRNDDGDAGRRTAPAQGGNRPT
jgi:hypothetical protein